MCPSDLFVVPLPGEEQESGFAVAALPTRERVDPFRMPSESIDVPQDLSGLSARGLRALCDDVYNSLDADFPPYGAYEDYARIVEELGRRETLAAGRRAAAEPRAKFRDNPARSRFELYHDGVMTGYLNYTLRAGRITLLSTVVAAPYEETGLAATLIKEALLNAHRRRLAPIPSCPHTRAFLTANPQFSNLLPTL